MFVQNCKLSRHDVITVSPEKSLSDALAVMKFHDFTGLPVIDGDLYAGMLTRGAIHERYFQTGGEREKFLTETKVGDLTFAKELVVKDEDVFENTLYAVNDLPFIGVVDGAGRFSGIVTRTVILEMFQACFGMKRRGVRVAFTAAEMEGRIAKLADITHQYRENIISLATFDETDTYARRIVMKVDKHAETDKFIEKLESHGFSVLSVNET